MNLREVSGQSWWLGSGVGLPESHSLCSSPGLPRSPPRRDPTTHPGSQVWEDPGED